MTYLIKKDARVDLDVSPKTSIVPDDEVIDLCSTSYPSLKVSLPFYHQNKHLL